ncbi:MAG TPA: bifunctional UDP-N-acetylglucosamine diphosphorylase/glucosamine-1-phosphate N-acetyltransferase GlmU [Steroidobacteraceae bacterium]|nr:bifunctional UDP-N-acetylglucosamine diphosphorylase/glucosamine-1-phosphate N-acetyltransferase GlmU [Steroidobacteraceae bacterium]
MQLSVVILAAGQGKRMHSDLPKVLQPLAGQPLLQHVIRTARALEPAHIYVVYGYGGAQVQAALSNEPVEWVLQADQLGTGHAVMQAMCVIPDDHTVLVLYGDVPLIRTPSLAKLVSLADEGALAVLSVDLEDAAGYGRIVRNAEGQIRAIVEHKDANPEQLQIRELNTGLMAAPARHLREWLLGLGNSNSSREYYLTDVVAGAVQAGHRVEPVRCTFTSEVMGVNDKIQLSKVEALYRRERAEELMLAGATVADPERIDIRGEVTVGRDVFIDVNAVLVGAVDLAAGVKIGPNCIISDSQIGAGTEIHANSIIDHAIVAENCRIGPFARVRPGSTLHHDVHIGNFVEIKSSDIGAGSKANHLAYVGDSQVGRGVNVGAGTITCNYDGLNKWPTFIGDGVFIGSGSMLVAPVRIGVGATIGAGSTITQNAPDGELTLTRAKQTTVAGWQRPTKLDEEEKAAVIDAALKHPKA